MPNNNICRGQLLNQVCQHLISSATSRKPDLMEDFTGFHLFPDLPPNGASLKPVACHPPIQTEQIQYTSSQIGAMSHLEVEEYLDRLATPGSERRDLDTYSSGRPNLSAPYERSGAQHKRCRKHFRQEGPSSWRPGAQVEAMICCQS